MEFPKKNLGRIADRISNRIPQVILGIITKESQKEFLKKSWKQKNPKGILEGLIGEIPEGSPGGISEGALKITPDGIPGAILEAILAKNPEKIPGEIPGDILKHFQKQFIIEILKERKHRWNSLCNRR